MSSGIRASKDCADKFVALKQLHKFKFVIFKINDTLDEIVVESTSADHRKDEEGKDIPMKEDMYDEFLARFPSNEGRYAVYDFDYTLKDGGDRSRILFYAWAPDSARIRSRMIYTSSKSDFRKKLEGVAEDIQANDEDGLSRDAVLDKLMSKYH
ncbi:cofilin [Coemansia sp. RSA 552]|nr:cofilin [Coemansia sp. RSA 552]